MCFDLEDSVPPQLKAAARTEVAGAVEQLSTTYPAMGLFVRHELLGDRAGRT